MSHEIGPEQVSGEQISPERLKLHNLGLLALTGREQDILAANTAAIIQERLATIRREGYDPHYAPPAPAAEPLSDIGYFEPPIRKSPAERLLFIPM